MILKKIFSNDYDYVFKGGTSLSKCFHLINRFSEDIDISYEISYDEAGSSNINKKFKGITNAVKECGLKIENKDRLRRSAYFNQFRCPYNPIVQGPNNLNSIIIELAGQTPSFPNEKKTIQSFIGQYLEDNGRHDLVIQYELEPFEINVQKLERTLVDKIYAMCDYYLSNKCQRHSRHIYDVHKILTVVELNSSLADLFMQVREYRIKIPVCLSAQEGIKLYDILDKIISEKVFETDFNTITAPLLYETVKYKECETSLIKIQKFLLEHNI